MSAFAHLPAVIRLGDLEVNRLGFGAMQLPGPMVWGEPRNPDKARTVLRRVIELGINFIDTAWYYGPLVANRLIAETLYPYPANLVIATKLGGRRTSDKGWVAALRPDELRIGCEEDLRSLRRECLDVVHLRVMQQEEVPFLEALDAMIELRQQGKIRHLALSNVSLAQLRAALERTPIVAVENLYNVATGEKHLGAAPFGVVADQEQMVDLCAARGMAFLPFFALAIPGRPSNSNETLQRIAQRRHISEAQLAIAWLLARSPAILPIPGTSSPAHLEDNWSARTIALSPEERAAITAARS